VRVYRPIPNIVPIDEDAVENDFLVPAQLLSSRATSPEARLWIAVIEDATRCLRDRRLRRETWQWFVSDDESVGSFRWIIAMLGFDPDAFQSILRRKKRIRIRLNARMQGRDATT
jgi:hypothetical protein